MKKILFTLLGLTLLMTMTACGSDEPQDNVLYLPPTQIINHTFNTLEDQVVSVTNGAMQISVNVSKMTAAIYYLFYIGDESVTVQVTNAAVTYDSNHSGYLIQTTTPTPAGAHTVTALKAFIEVRDIQQNLRHYIRAEVDGKYEVNGLMSVIYFKDAVTSITSTDNSETTTENGSFYRFDLLSMTTENRSATASISDIDQPPFSVGATYAGLSVEPCNEGVRFYHNAEDPINNSNGANYQLTQLDGIINMRNHSFNVQYTIDGLGTAHADGTMF